MNELIRETNKQKTWESHIYLEIPFNFEVKKSKSKSNFSIVNDSVEKAQIPGFSSLKNWINFILHLKIVLSSPEQCGTR